MDKTDTWTRPLRAVVRVVRGTRARNFTLSPTTGVYTVTCTMQARGMNSERFNAFHRDVADGLPDNRQCRVLVFDNASSDYHAGNVEFSKRGNAVLRQSALSWKNASLSRRPP